ncbi:MAG TPA: hypothetical protein VF092_30880 [Longimicrobium sp.]
MKSPLTLRGILMIPAVLLGVAAAWAGGAAVRYKWLAADRGDDARYVPRARITSGSENVFVFIGASFCGACRDPGLPPVVERAKLLAQRRAAAEHHAFRTIGVSIDWNQPRGLEMLRRFGDFDQVAAGGNWLNEEAVKYIWRDVPGRAVVPQIILLERTVNADAGGIMVSREVLRERVVGEVEIRTWVRIHASGSPPTPANPTRGAKA